MFESTIYHSIDLTLHQLANERTNQENGGNFFKFLN